MLRFIRAVLKRHPELLPVVERAQSATQCERRFLSADVAPWTNFAPQAFRICLGEKLQQPRIADLLNKYRTHAGSRHVYSARNTDDLRASAQATGFSIANVVPYEQSPYSYWRVLSTWAAQVDSA